jgi:hypothetical protein
MVAEGVKVPMVNEIKFLGFTSKLESVFSKFFEHCFPRKVLNVTLFGSEMDKSKDIGMPFLAECLKRVETNVLFYDL